jgi:hypothetical protein
MMENKINKYIAIMVLLTVISAMPACGKKGILEGFNIHAFADVHVLDEEGNDLLDPNKSYLKSVDLSQLYLIYIIDGKEHIVNEPNLDDPRGYRLLSPEGKYTNYRLRISLNIGGKESVTTTLMKWSGGQIDTIDADINRAPSSIICTKIIFNGHVVWDVESAEDILSFTIIK